MRKDTFNKLIAGTGAEILQEIGFKPRRVRIMNRTQKTLTEWDEEMLSLVTPEYGVVTNVNSVAATSKTIGVPGDGIQLFDGNESKGEGIKIGVDSELNQNNDEIIVEADT